MIIGKDTAIKRRPNFFTNNLYSLREGPGTEFISASSSSVIANLPTISLTNDGHNVVLWNTGDGMLAVGPADGETIDGAGPPILGKDEWRWMQGEPAGWKCVAAGMQPAGASGKVSQIVHRKLDDFASGSANHLRNDSKPLVTDMDPVPGFSQTITPSGPSDIHVHVTLQVSNSTAGWVLGGLFMDNNAQAQAVAEGYITAGTDDQTLSFWFNETVTDATPITFKVYMATSNGTWYLNGSTGGRRLFGGAWYSSMAIIEVSHSI